MTGHTEVVLVVFDPAKISYEDLLRVFWENHDPDAGHAPGQRRRHAVPLGHLLLRRRAAAGRRSVARRVSAAADAAGYGPITTEILPAPEFYYAEDYHQQYLAKNPDGYCGLGGTGVSCPVGVVATTRATSRSRPAFESPVARSSSACTTPPFRSIRSSTTIAAHAAAVARCRRHRPAWRRQDHARAAGAVRRWAADPAAAAPRRGAGDRAAHRRRARLDDRPGNRLAGPLRAPFQPRHAAARGDRRLLTARLQQDPLLSDFRTIVLDEFHERSIHADLAIALAQQAWRARDDLRIVVMSATLDARRSRRSSAAVRSSMCRAACIRSRSTTQPGSGGRCRRASSSAATTGDVLCFLPGAFEIQARDRRAQRPRRAPACDIVPLHGSLDAAEQDRALRPATPHGAGSSSRPTSRRRR